MRCAYATLPPPQKKVYKNIYYYLFHIFKELTCSM